MSAFDLYLITRLDNIREFCIITLILCVIIKFVLVVAWVVHYYNAKDENKSTRNFFNFKWLIPLLLFSCLGVVMIPTTKEIAVIYLVPKIINQEDVRQMPEKAMHLLRLKLDQWIDGLETGMEAGE